MSQSNIEPTYPINEVSIVDLEAIEFAFAESVHHQTERLLDIIEEIDSANLVKWKDSPDKNDGMAKLGLFIERVKRVRENSLDLPEFLERRDLGNHPGYEYIPRMLNSWNRAKATIDLAKSLVHKLPTRPEESPEPGSQKKASRNCQASTTPIEQTRWRDLRKKGQALDQKLKNLDAPKVTNFEHAHYSGQTRATNDLSQSQLLSAARTYKPTSTSSLASRSTSRRAHYKDSARDEYRRQTQTWIDDDLLNSDDPAFHGSSTGSKGYSPLYYPRQHQHQIINSTSDPQHDEYDPSWIEVKTKRHPQSGKPRHYGKIVSFKNLFMNSFQIHQLYDPHFPSACNNSRYELEIPPFDGENIEFYQEFERGILMKTINNVSDDWDAKFFTLLNCTSGIALITVQAYNELLTMENFIQAIEDLYYSFGQPNMYRDALICHLSNEDYIDLRKPSSLMRVKCLITKLTRAFGTDVSACNSNEAKLSQTLIYRSIKMTEEAKASYQMFIMARQCKNDLSSLTAWINYMYKAMISDPSLFRHLKSTKPPGH